jgi:hypothetical protein
VANFLPEHARAPSEKAKNVPLAGLTITGGDVVPELVGEQIDEERDNMRLCEYCSSAENGVRSEALSDRGLGLGESFSSISLDLRRTGDGERLGCGLIRGASPLPPSMIQREGSHSLALSPQTLGLEWIPVALTAMRVPCGITYV